MDVVRNYLQRLGCPDFVVQGGIARLIERWERVVASVVAGQEQFEDDYLNDMDGRGILEEVLAVAPPIERNLWSDRIAAADQRIRSHLLPTRECIWGKENAQSRGYARERDWWYFHRPRVVEPGWSAL